MTTLNGGPNVCFDKFSEMSQKVSKTKYKHKKLYMGKNYTFEIKVLNIWSHQNVSTCKNLSYAYPI